MNTKISYLYRDADNYKMHNKCVIAGTLTTEQTRTIKDCCEMGEYFIPRQVGLLNAASIGMILRWITAGSSWMRTASQKR